MPQALVFPSYTKMPLPLGRYWKSDKGEFIVTIDGMSAEAQRLWSLAMEAVDQVEQRRLLDAAARTN